MTQETVIIADLKDIAAIRFRCKCGATQSLNPDGNTIVPDVCNQCRESWMRQGDTNYQLLSVLLARLKDARKLQERGFSVEIVLPRQA